MANKKSYTKREMRKIAVRYAHNWDYTERGTMGADRGNIELQVIYSVMDTLNLMDEFRPLMKEEMVKVMDAKPSFYEGKYEHLREV